MKKSKEEVAVDGVVVAEVVVVEVLDLETFQEWSYRLPAWGVWGPRFVTEGADI